MARQDILWKPPETVPPTTTTNHYIDKEIRTMDSITPWENPTKISDPTMYHWRCERLWAARDRRLDRLVLRCLRTSAGLLAAATCLALLVG